VGVPDEMLCDGAEPAVFQVTIPSGTRPMGYRLHIELVPQPLGGINLRLRLGSGRWRKLRQARIDAIGPGCAICRSLDRPHAHEIWEYRERKQTGTALLNGVEIICQNCHDLSHWGRTHRLIRAGKVTQGRHEVLKRHFKEVNQCAQEDFEAMQIRLNLFGAGVP
jgi:hypothetical protein